MDKIILNQYFNKSIENKKSKKYVGIANIGRIISKRRQILRIDVIECKNKADFCKY